MLDVLVSTAMTRRIAFHIVKATIGLSGQHNDLHLNALKSSCHRAFTLSHTTVAIDNTYTPYTSDIAWIQNSSVYI